MIVEKLKYEINKNIIEDFQKTYNLKLPKDYSDFLLEFNGIIPQDETTIYVEDLKTDIEPDSLYGLGINEKWLNIDFWMQKYHSELPENSLIIGCDLLNGIFVLDCNEEDGGVFYWDAAFYFPSSEDGANAYWVADSFSEFRSKLGDFKFE